MAEGERVIPPDFARRMADAFGEDGRRWAAELPRLIEEFASRWGLRVGPPFELSYNYAAPATTADGMPVVLRLGCPRPEFDAEFEALRAYDGRGCVRLLDGDSARGAMLLERLLPGHTLATVKDDERATEIAAGLMAQLRFAPPTGHHFPSTQDWMRGLEKLRARFGGGTGPFPARLVDRAERLSVELHASAAPAVLLHGDLHHYNILAAERAPWLIIDPQGVVGEPAYETGALLRNPLPQVYAWPDFAERTARRVAILAERLGEDRRRIAGWGLAQAVLSAWWTMEETGLPDEPVLRLAEVLAPHC
jgi:streptomycin 6-kinase